MGVWPKERFDDDFENSTEVAAMSAMAAKGRSLTRPRGGSQNDREHLWQSTLGRGIALAGVAALMVFFVISAVVAGWVSDLTDPGFANVAGRLGQVETWQAWLRPASIATIGVIQIGIAFVLRGIVLRLWGRVDALKEAIPVFIENSRGQQS